VKKRYLALEVLAILVCLVIGLYGIGTNVQRAQTLAQQVVNQDQVDQDTTAQQTLLKDFVTTHMYATSTVFLQGSYDRAVQSANSLSAANSQVYIDADNACASKANSIVQAQCHAAYLAQHLTPGAPLSPTTPPSKDKFTLTWHSPLFAPDMVGISFALALVLLVALISQIMATGVNRRR
jgi:hypothetical protein